MLNFINKQFAVFVTSYFAINRRPKRSFSNCKKLYQFLGMRRNEQSMIRLVVLMML
jgi:hypothetical protein